MRHKYFRNKKYKQHLKQLQNECWWAVWDKGTHLKRSDFAKAAKKFYKNYTNRILRRGHKEHYHKGGGYKRVFDYWWQIW